MFVKGCRHQPTSGSNRASYPVGKTNGYVRFSSSDSPDSGEVHECEQEHPQALPCVTIDQFLEEQGIIMDQNDLIKIDAEGADFEVLLGAQKTITRFHPQITVTTYHRDEHVEQIVTLLKTLVPQYRMRLKGFSFWINNFYFLRSWFT